MEVTYGPEVGHQLNSPDLHCKNVKEKLCAFLQSVSGNI